MSDNLDLIRSIAADLQVKEAFIEKDLYAMRLIADLAKINHPKIQLVFSGGTSLSKGHGLIQRFSEDLDFKVSLNGEVTRKERRDFREQVIEAIGKSEQLNVDKENVKSGNSSRFFKMQVFYPQALPPSDALRNHIQLEVTFEEPTLPPENRSLTSFIAQAKGEEPEVQSIPCISPVETAADKLSALTWRVLDRDRTRPNDDATLVRHLHDLAALSKTVKSSNQFNELAHKSLEKDAVRSKTTGSKILSPIERMGAMLHTLKSDSVYKDEFSKFVIDLSYASNEARPTFENSLNALESLIEGVQEQYLPKLNASTQAVERTSSGREQNKSTSVLKETAKPEDWPKYAAAIDRGQAIQARIKETVEKYNSGIPLDGRSSILMGKDFNEFNQALKSIQDWLEVAQQLGEKSNYFQKISEVENNLRQGKPLSDAENRLMNRDKNLYAYIQLSVGLNQDDPKSALTRLAANAFKKGISRTRIKEILAFSPVIQAIKEEKGEQASLDFTNDIAREGWKIKKQEQPKRPPPGQQRGPDIDRGPSL